MKRFIKLTLIGLFLLTASLSFAQVGKVANNGVRAVIRVPKPGEVSRTLKIRAETSYKKALEVQKQYPEMFEALDDGPLKGIFPNLRHAELIYPDKPFLVGSPKNLTNYFIANHNRYLIRLVPQLNALQESLRANIPNFQKAQVTITHPIEKDMHWLAGRVPPNASCLLLGEYHNNSYLPGKISQLLRELRLQQPDRQIILLTEFLYEDTAERDMTRRSAYAPIWEAANESGISILGLEPDFERHFVYHITYGGDNHNIKYLNNFGYPSAAKEGVRLRNASWLASIQKIRQQYPEALLIIYAGDGHIRSWYPFSLRTALQEQKPFTVSFVPEDEITLFDKTTDGQFKTRVLSFKGKELRGLFGTDVEIRVPPGYSDPWRD